ncbi:response regulator transcription factor [Yersinia alsatica]|uniref:Response regulator transcription factor n=2 Tax=Yersinia alsatica TaxID=2890317 RepID=A0ABY5UU90_9GAMM|nr:response regulator transcription factor [Yersinia alsatica]OVZ92658.1 DNA-binding response regulator [Yersinia frederiksenii]OWF69480.1 DNA-binding response regulator [Yersinia frederiksenii]UWM46110.1 response regulator transcription factor [Yersinia alsatica]CFQ47583.1 transcriptional regulator RcsB [Yersinia frederiksenii]CNC34505.1 transcriptional regulator RcsB [Yersinia frederiksenii]
MMKKLRVVLLDDHKVVLAGMKYFLDQIPGINVVDTFDKSADLIRHVTGDPPDVIITDYNMPKDEVHKDGLKFVGYLLRMFPDIKLLVLTMISNPMIVSALYDQGVSGVVFKQDPLDEMATALRSLRANNRYYPPSFQSEGRRDEREIFLRERINSLSPREFEVLRYFVEGESISHIAEKLNRSAKTISLQKNSAMRKLNVDSSQELIRFCIGNHIFE